MKQIENIDLQKCYNAAKQQVQDDLEAQVTKQIKVQLMAVAQLQIKTTNSVMESSKLGNQLQAKIASIAKIEQGDWSALPETAKERDENAEATKDKEDTKKGN